MKNMFLFLLFPIFILTSKSFSKEEFSFHPFTPLEKMDKNGELKPIKTVGGHRRYKLSDLKIFIGEINDIEENIAAIYSRDQKVHGDLDRQSQCNLEYCVKYKYKVRK
jgi:predicted site-specific integrase-resolvase